MLSTSPYDLISFQMEHLTEHAWTTEKIFTFFNVSHNNHDIRTSGQYIATAMIMQKRPHLRKWLDLIWQALKDDEWLFSDKYNEEAKRNDQDFRDNRHDQSVASVSQNIVGSVVIKDEVDAPLDKEHPFWTTRRKN
jgi:hypothetical protein